MGRRRHRAAAAADWPRRSATRRTAGGRPWSPPASADRDPGGAARAQLRAESTGGHRGRRAGRPGRGQLAAADRGRARAAARASTGSAVLEEYGLLPNYTLLDDSVTLDVALELARPGDPAVRLDDRARTGAARRPPCTSSRPARPSTPAACRSRSTPWTSGVDADRGHVLVVLRGVRLRQRRATPATAATGLPALRQHEHPRRPAAVRRRRADPGLGAGPPRRGADQRPATTSASAPASPCWRPPTSTRTRIVRQWFVDGYDFGARYLRSLTIRWLNLGRGPASAPRGPSPAGPSPATCSGCARAAASSTARRGPTGPTSTAPGAATARRPRSTPRPVLLTRTLVTQGVVIPLPWSVSLGRLVRGAEPGGRAPARAAGAVRRLARPHRGRRPRSTRCCGGDNREALLLHDLVPGGTGYLAELATPDNVWALLRAAWQVVATCPCAGRGSTGLPPLPAALRAAAGDPTRCPAQRPSGICGRS